ncbi:PQQ-dependent sugar dehydrogenase [Algirhabdus cladophorae]|uniref:PQQ-dependent sugar dehydrogenase n=1 Tax=Algirhabdus cladophorae TaxID=3377108 RepID=UPI003B84985E
MWRALVLLLIFTQPLAAFSTSQPDVEVVPMIRGLDEPWGLGFLPDGSVLVTERDGRLLHAKNGEVNVIKGLPRIAVQGQGGLLDVMVPRDFAQSSEVFFSFSKKQGRGAGTALAVAEFDANQGRLRNVRVIFELAQGSTGGRHFGSRIVEARDGSLFLTIGDRGDRPSAQDLSVQNGSVVRVNRDGTVPASNPFVDQSEAQPHIWSYGHRNPQGAALDNAGNLWVVEHGAKGGDEVNRITKGANFGWPVISYGEHYSGAKIGEGTAKAGMQQPEFYWDPSIAPSGMMIYSGALWPEWKGSMFVGSLKFDYISRLDPRSSREVEQIKSDATQRVRDVVEAPDGSIWFLSVGQGAAYRVTPK